MSFDVTAFFVLWVVSLLLGGAAGFLLERVTHTCPGAGQPATGGSGGPAGDLTPASDDDTAAVPLGVYAETRISMLDDLAPPRLLDVAILLSLWHPDAVDAALVMTGHGPLELGAGR